MYILLHTHTHTHAHIKSHNAEICIIYNFLSKSIKYKSSYLY